MRLASNIDPNDWRSYKVAKSYVDIGLAHGLGFALTGSQLCAFDLDHCFDADGNLYPSARALVERCASYCEWTPSRDGLRILGTADIAAKRQCVINMPEGWNLEVYEAGCTRFITVSGRPFESYCLPVRDLGEITSEYFKERDARQPQPTGSIDDGPLDWARFCSAVRSIPNDGTAIGIANWKRGVDRDTVWVPLGACIYRTGHPNAWKLFFEFTRKSPKFHRTATAKRVWKSFEKNLTPTSGRIWTAGTIYWIAQQNGWNDPNLGPPLTETITLVTDEDLWALFPDWLL